MHGLQTGQRMQKTQFFKKCKAAENAKESENGKNAKMQKINIFRKKHSLQTIQKM